jgi:hypothetical protein
MTTRRCTAITTCRSSCLGPAEFEYMTNSTYICKISLYFACIIYISLIFVKFRLTLPLFVYYVFEFKYSPGLTAENMGLPRPKFISIRR